MHGNFLASFLFFRQLVVVITERNYSIVMAVWSAEETLLRLRWLALEPGKKEKYDGC